MNKYIILFCLLVNTPLFAGETTQYEITSPTSGVVEQIHVIVGKQVAKGDLLLSFDDSLILSNLSEAQATIKLAKLNQIEAKKEQDRAEELYDRTVLSEHDLQQARVANAKALAQFAQAKNQLQHALWDKKHSKLSASFSGEVLQILAYPGQYVNNQFTAQPLFIIKPK